MEPKLLHLCNDSINCWSSSPGTDITRERIGAGRGPVGQKVTPLNSRISWHPKMFVVQEALTRSPSEEGMCGWW